MARSVDALSWAGHSSRASRSAASRTGARLKPAGGRGTRPSYCCDCGRWGCAQKTDWAAFESCCCTPRPLPGEVGEVSQDAADVRAKDILRTRTLDVGDTAALPRG